MCHQTMIGVSDCVDEYLVTISWDAQNMLDRLDGM
jgi:hypothetical protein